MPTERIGENVYRLHGNIPLEQVDWWEDVFTLAKLWRWLVFRDLRPHDPAYFIEHAEEWAEEHAAMLLWTGERDG